PLESIAIFTDDDDSVELAKVFQNMVDQLEDNPPIPANSSSEALRDYFTDVLPNHDRDKVHISDIKKLLKWFAFLQERNLLTAEAATGDATEEEEE
ncbi:MAG: hypothetical protein KDC44_05265, partial [Phaeodactylibacter sp.]|nr:hypothetical protein [Phaeodactylibacter sp.]